MKAVMTQAICSTPSSSPTMVGSAVANTVWPIAAMSIARISAEKISHNRRPVGCSGAAEGSVRGWSTLVSAAVIA